MKVFLTLMAGDNSIEDLRELFEPIKAYFCGICAVCFAEMGSEEAIYLETNKGEGYITYLPYTGRHDLARVCAVHCGAIQDGDIVVQFDALERLSPQFAAFIPELVTKLSQVDAFFYYGKILIYRYHESVTFNGTPHEGWSRSDKRFVSVELSQSYPNEADVRLNVRPIKRADPFHFVRHYARYYIETPWGGNHCILGLEKNGDVGKLFPEREARRMAFRDTLRKANMLSVDAVIQFIQTHKPDEIQESFKGFLRKEKILNDLWRYYVLGRRDFVDDHDHKNLVDIP